MTGAQMLDECLDLRLDPGKGEGWGGLIDIGDIPIADPVDPMGKPIAHHGAVFGLVQRHDDGGLGQIALHELFRCVAREEAGHRLDLEPVSRVRRERCFFNVRAESPRFGAPGQTVARREEIEPCLRVAAPIKVTGAEEEDGLPVFHVGQYVPGSGGNQLGNVKGLTREGEGGADLRCSGVDGNRRSGLEPPGSFDEIEMKASGWTN